MTRKKTRIEKEGWEERKSKVEIKTVGAEEKKRERKEEYGAESKEWNRIKIWTFSPDEEKNGEK